MKQKFIEDSVQVSIPAPIRLKFSIKEIEVFANVNSKGKVANFFRRLGVTDDYGYPDGKHIGNLQYENVDDLYYLFKTKYPEELL